MPGPKRRRYLQMKLALADVLTLTDDMDTAQYFDAVLDQGAPLKPAANWVMGDLMAHCKASTEPPRFGKVADASACTCCAGSGLTHAGAG